MRSLGAAVRSRWGAALAAIPAAVIFVVYFDYLRPAYVDDSFIFYRYAENWGSGHGLAFNPGEHVEGYSSFLWTAMLALGKKVGASAPSTATALGLVLGIACVVACSVVARRLFGSVLVAAVAAAALALCTGLAFFAAAGMDATLFAVVLLVSVAVAGAQVDAARRGASSRSLTAAGSTCAVLLVLTRAEGFAYALLIGAAVYFATRRERPARSFAITAAVATVAVFVIRKAVYDAWLPATVTAKAYFSHTLAAGDLPSLARIVKDGLVYEGAFVLLLLAAIAAALLRARRRGRQVPAAVSVAALVVALNVTITVLNSGDWMVHRRLLVPVMPLLVLLVIWAARELTAERREASYRVALVASLAACVVVVFSLGLKPDTKPGDQRLAAIGRALRQTNPPVRLLTNIDGVVPYYAGPRTYVWDLLGLTDSHNARHGSVFVPRYGRTDPKYDFSRPFDVLVTNSASDLTLMVQAWSHTPAQFGRYVILAPSYWAQRKLYVVARRGAPFTRTLAGICTCSPSPLGEPLRTQLLHAASARRALQQ